MVKVELKPLTTALRSRYPRYIFPGQIFRVSGRIGGRPPPTALSGTLYSVRAPCVGFLGVVWRRRTRDVEAGPASRNWYGHLHRMKVSRSRQEVIEERTLDWKGTPGSRRKGCKSRGIQSKRERRGRSGVAPKLPSAKSTVPWAVPTPGIEKLPINRLTLISATFKGAPFWRSEVDQPVGRNRRCRRRDRDGGKVTHDRAILTRLAHSSLHARWDGELNLVDAGAAVGATWEVTSALTAPTYSSMARPGWSQTRPPDDKRVAGMRGGHERVPSKSRVGEKRPMRR